MNESAGSFLIGDAVVAQDMVLELGARGDAEVTVEIAGIFVDVCRVTYDRRREKIVLHLHPDDVDDVLRRGLSRRTSTVDQAAECAAGEGREL